LQARAIEGAGFHDAFVEAGVGRGSTWPVNGIFRYLPGIRLDHVFLSPRLACRTIRTGTGYGSDHRPLVAEIVIVEPKR
jgi:endonuclease/exonuclease/phosphatase (EEP) superfamily protein YafD